MDVISKFDTVIFLFLLLVATSAAAYFKIPINDMVFGALLLALNVKNGNGNGSGKPTNGSTVVAGPDTPKA